MIVDPNLSEVAGMIADPSRARMLVALLNVTALPASELAAIAGIKPQTASLHLAKMVSAGLLIVEAHGRHRYYKIASAEVAAALESLARISKDAKPTLTKESKEMRAIRAARTCYGHLAGKLGVNLCDHLVQLKFLVLRGEIYEVTERGEHEFEKYGIQIAKLKTARRVLAKPCLDWSERRYHLAGSLGVKLTDWLVSKKYLRLVQESRAVTLTEKGKEFLLSVWNFNSTD